MDTSKEIDYIVNRRGTGGSMGGDLDIEPDVLNPDKPEDLIDPEENPKPNPKPDPKPDSKPIPDPKPEVRPNPVERPRVDRPRNVLIKEEKKESDANKEKKLRHKAYICGYPDGSVKPNGNITRAEAAAMLARLLDIEDAGSEEKPAFPDTKSSWYNKAINAVVERGIMKGYPDGRFRPNAPITRAEFTQMIAMMDKKPEGEAPFEDIVGHWAEKSIAREYAAGRIEGYPDGTFKPNADISRCEAAVILNKIFERDFDEDSLLKCINPEKIKTFIDLKKEFWGYKVMVEATNTHDFLRRYIDKVNEDWLEIIREQ